MAGMKHFPKEGSEHTSPSQSSGEIIEIPVGKWLGSVRKNPWIISTFVLAIVLVVVLFMQGAGVGGSVETSDKLSAQEAGAKLLSFINKQGNGNAELISSEQEGALYKVNVKYQGQDIPAFVTLDGEYLVAQPIPLSDEAQQRLLADLPDTSDTENSTGNSIPPAIAELNISNNPMMGNKSAEVIFVEFTDYECPFCGRHYQQTYPQIIKNYVDTKKVLLVLKDFPLSQIHPEAQKSAEAAHCVREQKSDDGYFKMHDKLFENQQSLSVENYKKWARELGVNGVKFDACLDSGKFASVVSADAQEGQIAGVSGTPAFFINGKIIEGACPYSTFSQVLDVEIEGKEWAVTNCQVRLL